MSPEHSRVIQALEEAQRTEEAKGEILGEGRQWAEATERLSRMVHEAKLVPHGPEGEVARWNPPNPTRMRTALSISAPPGKGMELHLMGGAEEGGGLDSEEAGPGARRKGRGGLPTIPSLPSTPMPVAVSTLATRCCKFCKSDRIVRMLITSCHWLSQLSVQSAPLPPAPSQGQTESDSTGNSNGHDVHRPALIMPAGPF